MCTQSKSSIFSGNDLYKIPIRNQLEKTLRSRFNIPIELEPHVNIESARLILYSFPYSIKVWVPLNYTFEAEEICLLIRDKLNKELPPLLDSFFPEGFIPKEVEALFKGASEI